MGSVPTANVSMTLSLSRSTTETLPSKELATYARMPSG